MTLALLAFGLSFILNLIIILVARRLDWFIDSLQKPQKFHSNPTPRAGGIGIFLPFLCLNSWLYLQNPSPLVLGLLCGGGIVFLSGIVEDFNASLSPKFRLFLQCLGSGIFIALSGIYLKDLGFGIHLPSYLGIPFTLFALVGMINALNIIDGFNGLASGIALIALILIISLGLPSPLSLSILILIASILGFWLLNFPFGKIFLGDGGAYFLGFILASLLVGITQTPSGGGAVEASPWFGIAILIYPFWEVIFSIYRRSRQTLSPLMPDNAHLHQLLYQKLCKTPFANPLTSLLLLIINTPFMLLALFLHKEQNALALLSLAYILCYLLLYRRLQSPRGLD